MEQYGEGDVRRLWRLSGAIEDEVAQRIVDAVDINAAPWKLENEIIMLLGVPFYLLQRRGTTSLMLWEAEQQLQKARGVEERRKWQSRVDQMKRRRYTMPSFMAEPVGKRFLGNPEHYYALITVPDDFSAWYLGTKETAFPADRMDFAKLRRQVLLRWMAKHSARDQRYHCEDLPYVHLYLFGTDGAEYPRSTPIGHSLLRVLEHIDKPIVSEQPWIEVAMFDVLYEAYKQLEDVLVKVDKQGQLWFSRQPRFVGDVSPPYQPNLKSHIQVAYWHYTLGTMHWATARAPNAVNTEWSATGQITGTLLLCVPHPTALDIMRTRETYECEVAIRFTQCMKTLKPAEANLPYEGRIAIAPRFPVKPHLVFSPWMKQNREKMLDQTPRELEEAMLALFIKRTSVTRLLANAYPPYDKAHTALMLIESSNHLEFVSETALDDFYAKVYATFWPSAARQVPFHTLTAEFKEQHMWDVRRTAGQMANKVIWNAEEVQDKLPEFRQWHDELLLIMHLDINYYKENKTPEEALEAMAALLRSRYRVLPQINYSGTQAWAQIKCALEKNTHYLSTMFVM